METKVNNNYYAIAHKIVAICLYCRFYIIESWDFTTLNSQLLILNSNISIHPKP